ncbi:MAG: VWD domain-containing protein, partial [Catenulispora sp.]|nr:VWD domain-containing protein [Catenulispora sp.]
MRRFCMFMVAVLVATLIVPVRDAAVGADAAYAAWPSCTNDQKWTAGSSGEPKRCVNGVPYTTRRYLYAIPGCLAPAVSNLYPSRRFCSGNGGLEAIGQARAIRYLSDHLEPDPTRLISPNVQWEMFQGRKRPDIVVYDRNNAAAGVDVIEAKWEENDDYADWPNQVDGYINYFRAQGMPNVRRGATLNRWGPYLDVFEVMDNDTDCKTATGTTGKVRRTYEATSPQAGLLDIRENKSKRKCEDNPNPVPTPTTTAQPTSQPTSEPTSQPTPQPTTVPVPPFVYPLPEIIEELETVGASSLAEDIAAAGGVEEATELLIAEIYAELGTAEGAALLADAGFISVELALAGGAVALVALLAFFIWWYIHHHGGNAGGDPHFHTIDGLHYDLQSAGEFTLAHSEFYGMELQGRLVPMSSSSGISVLKRVATELNDHTVEFEGSAMYVDGVARTLADGHILFFGEDKFVIKKNGAYFVLYRGLAGPLFIWNGSASLYVPQAADNDLQGLFGNANGDPKDDLKLIDGTQLPWDASATVRHGDFADSWRIGDDQSLFAYAAGQSTGTFTDLTFPHNVTTVHDLTADQITLATTSCENAGVQPGPSFT